jgi:hypothetical protein
MPPNSTTRGGLRTRVLPCTMRAWGVLCHHWKDGDVDDIVDGGDGGGDEGALQPLTLPGRALILEHVELCLQVVCHRFRKRLHPPVSTARWAPEQGLCSRGVDGVGVKYDCEGEGEDDNVLGVEACSRAEAYDVRTSPVTVWCATALGSGGMPPDHRGAGSCRPLPCCRTSGERAA